jgi:hypothetical protein
MIVVVVVVQDANDYARVQNTGIRHSILRRYMHEIKRWNSAAEAAKYYNIQAANICACCTYRRNHCAGFKWRYFI